MNKANIPQSGRSDVLIFTAFSVYKSHLPSPGVLYDIWPYVTGTVGQAKTALAGRDDETRRGWDLTLWQVVKRPRCTERRVSSLSRDDGLRAVAARNVGPILAAF